MESQRFGETRFFSALFCWPFTFLGKMVQREVVLNFFGSDLLVFWEEVTGFWGKKWRFGEESKRNCKKFPRSRERERERESGGRELFWQCTSGGPLERSGFIIIIIIVYT